MSQLLRKLRKFNQSFQLYPKARWNDQTMEISCEQVWIHKGKHRWPKERFVKSFNQERQSQFVRRNRFSPSFRSVTGVFDMLEFSKRPTFQNVAPAFYFLRNGFNNVSVTNSPEVRKIKKECVAHLDSKIWLSITGIHLAATFLGPNLKEFSFVPEGEERNNLREQGKTATKEYALAVAEDLLSIQDDEVAVISIPTEGDVENPSKRIKKDIFSSFRVIKPQPSGSGLRREGQQYDTTRKREDAVRTELLHYVNIDDPYQLYDADGDDQVFGSLKWWRKNRYKFPILSSVAKSVFVVQASSAESERNFSKAGKVTKKDRARLRPVRKYWWMRR